MPLARLATVAGRWPCGQRPDDVPRALLRGARARREGSGSRGEVSPAQTRRSGPHTAPVFPATGRREANGENDVAQTLLSVLRQSNDEQRRVVAWVWRFY